MKLLDDTALSFFLAGMYAHLRDLRRAHHELQKMASATRLALQEAPGFEVRYAEHWAEQSALLDGQLLVATEEIDEIIRRLREG